MLVGLTILACGWGWYLFPWILYSNHGLPGDLRKLDSQPFGLLLAGPAILFMHHVILLRGAESGDWGIRRAGGNRYNRLNRKPYKQSKRWRILLQLIDNGFQFNRIA